MTKVQVLVLGTMSSRGPNSFFLLLQLYESALTENQKLKTKLQEAQLELADVKTKLEKVAQVSGEKKGDGWRVVRVGQRKQRKLGVFVGSEKIQESRTGLCQNQGDEAS